MELGLSNTLLAGDPRLVDHIVGEVKSQGIFDQFRKECIADVDTKPAYQNLRTRVEGSVNSFLGKQAWKPDLNKNQLRETLRKHIHEASYLDAGVERIVDQVVNPKVFSVFMPQIEDVVYKFLGIERPKTKERNGACGLKDLLPKDLDPVSPESDKNSLKDVSLESVDAMEDLEGKKDEKLFNEQKVHEEDIFNEKCKDSNSENGQLSSEEKMLDESGKSYNKTGSNSNLNVSGKSDDKTEEDEEDSPTFEPIDIMNLNESNISNDSHLSGISELTSHRSRSPDFCNELSRDNFDYSNQDSQLSKVSSDSRLSIVTDFGSSNHASTPIHDSLKETNKDKCDVKNSKDNFKAVREFESNTNKSGKNIFELNKNKDLQDVKDSKSTKNNLSSKENSRDAMDSAQKDKFEHKNNKDKSKDSESKSKSKEKNHLKDGKHHRDKSSDKKKQKSHSSVKYDKYDKNKSKDKSDHTRENTEKAKDAEGCKDSSTKIKEDKTKDTDKKDSSSKEAKDLKDLYKEKIRELREKKELTEKEKLNKDSKEGRSSKENRDKKDSPRDKKSSKKDHKSSTSKNSVSSHDGKSVKSDKIVDGKKERSESKDKSKRDEKRTVKDVKSKNRVNVKTDVEKIEKQDIKKVSKNEKEEKTEKSDIKKDVKTSNDKTNGKKDTKNHSHSKGSSRNDKLDSKKDSKSELQMKDKKRRDDKKSKSKDDHSSLRKNSNDRRSTDRDGSNGSSSKSSHSSNSSSNVNSKSSASNLTKDTNHVSNSSSETSDSIEEAHTNGLKLSYDQSNYKSCKTNTEVYNEYNTDESSNDEARTKHVELESNETNLPLKKRPLLSDDNSSIAGEVKIKKPKFAKNIHEAKKLMKIRKQIEKQKLKENKKTEKKPEQKVEQLVQSSTTNNTDNFESVPDEERVQIIEIPDEEYEEPYPEKQCNLTLEERSIIMLESEPGTKDLLQNSNLKLKLSEMELCIRQSLSESLASKKLDTTVAEDTNFNAQMLHSDNKQDLDNIESSSAAAIEVVVDRNTVNSEKTESITEGSSKNEDVQEGIDVCKVGEEVPQTADLPDTTNLKTEHEILEQPLVIHNINIESISHLKDEEAPSPLQFTVDPEKDSHFNIYQITAEEASTTSQNKLTVTESTSRSTEDNDDCRYFKADNEKSEKFSNFLKSLELIESTSLEDIIESMGGQVVSSIPKAMAPPLPKRKHSSSPLTDILLNNSNNNNDGYKKELNLPNEDALNNIKKRKLAASKKQRPQANFCSPQGLLNGENFVMPLSPESDVSATSEKIPSSNLIKEDKGRHRSSQRYSSDDLYKPRPLFSSSSRRSRRSNQA